MRTRTTLVAAALILSAATVASCGSGAASDTEPTAGRTPPPAQAWEPPAPSEPAPSTTVSEPPAVPTRTVPSTPATPDEEVAGVDRHDPAAVGAEAVRQWLAWRPVTDGGPLDAMARTAPLLTDEYRESTLAEAPVRGPGGDFAAWRAEGADTVRVDVTAAPNQGAADNPGLKHLVFSATQTPVAAGKPIGTADQVVYVIVRQQPDRTWAVSKIVTR